ncbi:Asp23/Gls24 family envelope stress response protein [Nonomuraea sp. NPDC055795]
MSEVLAEQTEPTSTPAVVKGRIKVADEVVEKVAALAALEVAGVADMGGDLARAFESVRDRIGIGSRRGNQGVSAEIQDRQVAVNLVIVVEYGHVVMEVAAEVKTNVARTVSRMLGMRVTEVNVTVDDVRLPGEPRPTPPDPDDLPT